MSTLTTHDKVSRLLTFALGEPYGDGVRVTSVISGYAEPGYGNGDDVIVMGDWNPARFPRDGDPALTAEESLMPRLAEALERAGAELEWLDEWTECQQCYRAVRTTGDSYHWKPFYMWTDDGELICADCAVADGIDALAGYINEPTKCVTWCDPAHVESFGFVKWEPGDPHTYESGWHPGQTDEPAAILAEIHRADSAAEVVFFLDESSQFYIRFSAYVRDAKDSEYIGDDSLIYAQ